MQKVITVFLFCFLIFFSEGNNLVKEQPKAREVKKFEKQFNSQLISPSRFGPTYSIGSDLCPAVEEYEFAQPLRYARPGNILPPLLIEYYYSKSDSLVRCITYTMATPDDGSFDKFGIELYERIFSDVVATFEKELGEPDQLDKEFVKDSANSNFFKKEVEWKKDKMIIEGYLGKSNKRIRFTQRWQ